MLLRLSLTVLLVPNDEKTVTSTTSLLTFIGDHAMLKGTKFMCREGGCGSCIVAMQSTHPDTHKDQHCAVNSCLKLVLACHGATISTVEGIGSNQKGYHEIQKRLASYNGTQCGYCSPEMVMNMYRKASEKGSLKDNNSLTGTSMICATDEIQMGADDRMSENETQIMNEIFLNYEKLSAGADVLLIKSENQSYIHETPQRNEEIELLPFSHCEICYFCNVQGISTLKRLIKAEPVITTTHSNEGIIAKCDYDHQVLSMSRVVDDSHTVIEDSSGDGERLSITEITHETSDTNVNSLASNQELSSTCQNTVETRHGQILRPSENGEISTTPFQPKATFKYTERILVLSMFFVIGISFLLFWYFYMFSPSDQV